MKKTTQLALCLFVVTGMISIQLSANNPIEEKRKEFKKLIQKQQEQARKQQKKSTANPAPESNEENLHPDAMPEQYTGPTTKQAQPSKKAPAAPTGGGNSMDESAAAAVSVQ